MPVIQELSIALPAELAALVRKAVDDGEYASHSEVVRDALRDWTEKRDLHARGLSSLRSAWLEAVADDSDGEDPGPILDALERKYDALAQRQADSASAVFSSCTA